MRFPLGRRHVFGVIAVGLAGLVLAGRLVAIRVSAREPPLMRPTGLTADPAHDQVSLDWDDPSDPAITG